MNTIFKVLVVLLLFFSFSCKQDYYPKPRGYFRIEFPNKEYIRYVDKCPFEFNYPVYSTIEHVPAQVENECWQNIVFKDFNAKIHLTYVPLSNDLSKRTEDIRSIVYKHIIKAEDIKEDRIERPEDNVYGILYSISGNTASSLSFLLTDSLDHFISGSLYFSSIPNQDSLAPAIQFFREDVVHLTQSLIWK